MSDIKKLAEELVNLSVKDVNELATILKDEYGIEPAAAPVAIAAGPAAGGQRNSSDCRACQTPSRRISCSRAWDRIRKTDSARTRCTRRPRPARPRSAGAIPVHGTGPAKTP